MAFTVTATGGGAAANGIGLDLLVLNRCTYTQPGQTAGATSATPSLAITPNQTGSIVYGAQVGATGTYTANGSTTSYDSQTEGSVNVAFFRSAATTTGGTPVTLGYTSASSATSTVLAEIPSVGTETLDPTTPGFFGGSAATVTTSSFTPPNGSLLVALVAQGGNTGTATMAISDTSGLGLTWTEVVKQNTANDGYTGIWVARMPGGPAAGYRGFADTFGPTTVAASDATQYVFGLSFKVTQANLVLNGWWWWVSAAQNNAAEDFALWQTTSGTTGTYIANSKVTSGTFTAGQWNFVPCNNPIPLTSGQEYRAVKTVNKVVLGATDNYSSISDFWDTGLGDAGIVDGPLVLFSGGAATTNLEPSAGNQMVFKASASDVTADYPTGQFNQTWYGLDVQVGPAFTPRGLIVGQAVNRAASY